MFRKRVWFSVLVALLIVVLGGYWTFQGPQSDKDREGTAEEDLTSTQEEWTISPESVNFDGDVKIEGDTGFKGLSVSGRVQFPEDSEPESVDLVVRILPVSPGTIERLNNRSDGESLDEIATRYVRSDTLTQNPLRKVVVTSSNGRFSISNAPPGLYRAEIRDSEWLGSTKGSIVQRPNEVTSLDITARPTARLKGRVVDSEGDPVGNVTVRSIRTDRSVRTNEEGEFTFAAIPPGEPVDFLRIEQSGLEPISPSLSAFEPGEVREETFEVTRPRELTVRVRTESGQSVREGTVLLRRDDDRQLTPGEGELREGMRTQSLNDDGIVRFKGLWPGTVEVNLHHPRRMAEWKSVTLEEPSQETELTARRGHELTVDVRDDSTGEPVRGLLPRILAFDQQGNLLRPGLRGHRREEGTFRAVLHPQFSEGILRLDGERRGYRTKTIQFDRGDLNQLELSLTPEDANRSDDPPAFQKFRLPETFSGEALKRMELFFVDRESGRTVQTRSGGESILEETIPLPRGEFFVYGTVELTEDSNQVIGQNLRVESNHPDSRPLTFREPARLTGQLEGSSEDLQGLEVALDPTETSREVHFARDYPDPLRTKLDEDGGFTFDSVPPGTDLVLHVVTKRDNTLQLPPGTIVLRESVGSLASDERFSLPALSIP